MYLRDGKAVAELSRVGGLAVGVPGLVAGLVAVHEAHGSLPIETLMAPALRLARDGFPVYPELATRLASKKEVLASNPAMRAVFFSEGGETLRAGDILRQPDLAKTLAAIMEKGQAGFYEGSVAKAIIKGQRESGGGMTLRDLNDYKVKMRKPVRGTYRGYEVVSMPPPSSGGAHLVQMLNILQSANLRTYGVQTPASVHWLAESMRTAYTDRAAYMGDDDFVNVPLAWLTSEEYAKKIYRQIPQDRARKTSELSPGREALIESAETTHISIVDADGNAVSSTQTINFGFGACIMAPGTGIILNNEMDDFSAQPGVTNLYGLVGGEANAIAAGKRPLSSMTPTFLMQDGKPALVLGAPGGSKIITAVLQTIVNVVDHDLPLYEAVALPRMHHQALPDVLQLESGYFPERTRRALHKMGHDVQEPEGFFGQVQAIQIKADGTRIGASDPRVSGAAVRQP
jgi:gamma-glutamyltranspeptidase/glutathione hydrolase